MITKYETFYTVKVFVQEYQDWYWIAQDQTQTDIIVTKDEQLMGGFKVAPSEKEIKKYEEKSGLNFEQTKMFRVTVEINISQTIEELITSDFV